jgi:hypothetical protein
MGALTLLLFVVSRSMTPSIPIPQKGRASHWPQLPLLWAPTWRGKARRRLEERRRKTRCLDCYMSMPGMRVTVNVTCFAEGLVLQQRQVKAARFALYFLKDALEQVEHCKTPRAVVYD